MTKPKPFLFFVTKLVHRELQVEQLRTDAELQLSLTELFASQRRRLHGKDARPIDYKPGEACDEDEVFVIRDFHAPREIAEALKNHDLLKVLSTKGMEDKIRSIFAVAGNGEIMLQRFTARQSLAGKFQITLAKDTFRKQTSAGVLIAEELAALITREGVFFRKFEAAKAVLPNLADFFTEATDKQLMQFAKHSLLYVRDAGAFVARTSSWHRRRIAALQSEGLMNRLSVEEVQSQASRYGFELELRTNPKTKKLEIVLPESREGLKMTIKLLCNELLLSELTNERFAVPAKRKLGAKRKKESKQPLLPMPPRARMR